MNDVKIKPEGNGVTGGPLLSSGQKRSGDNKASGIEAVETKFSAATMKILDPWKREANLNPFQQVIRTSL